MLQAGSALTHQQKHKPPNWINSLGLVLTRKSHAASTRTGYLTPEFIELFGRARVLRKIEILISCPREIGSYKDLTTQPGRLPGKARVQPRIHLLAGGILRFRVLGSSTQRLSKGLWSFIGFILPQTGRRLLVSLAGMRSHPSFGFNPTHHPR